MKLSKAVSLQRIVLIYNNMQNSNKVGKVRILLDEISSTNDYLRHILEKSRPEEGTMVIAAKQSQGRGQHGSAWFTGSGDNLAISLLLYPIFLEARDHFLLTQFFSLAISDSLEALGCQNVAIKWPNDIYIGSKKVGGMLIENSIQGRHFSHAIFGLGLNVNQEVFPNHIPNPISIFQHLHTKVDFGKILDVLSQHIDFRYTQLLLGKITLIQRDYAEKLLGKGNLRNFRINKGTTIIQGKIQGTSPHGLLTLELKNGEICHFDLKEIQYIHE